jgi:hypothetical protein
MDEEDRASIEKALEGAQQVVQGNDVTAIRRATDELSTRSYKFAEQIYKNPSSSESPADGTEEDTVKIEEDE